MNIIVIGTDYVGLVAACCLSNSNHQVVCVESDESKLRLLSQGIIPIREKGIDELYRQGLTSVKLSFTSSLSKPLQADVVIVAIGTPYGPNGAVALSSIYQVDAELRDAANRPLCLARKMAS